MVRRKLMSKLCAMIVIALLASGAGQLKNTAFAQENTMTEKAALEQVVELHEKMNNAEVEIPQGIDNIETGLLKSVVLGYVNSEEAQKADAETVRKQDIANMLYKAVISYDNAYIMTSEESEQILNECNDNAYIDEENRIPYAFMIKYGIISVNVNSEPNKELSEENCKFFTDTIYELFYKKAKITVGKYDVVIGSNVQSLIEKAGEPNRIDVSEYGYDWYVYNEDYNNFMMVGVQSDRICAFYTNSGNFSIDGISNGDNYAKLISSGFEKNKDENLMIYTDAEGKVDAVLYNTKVKGSDNNEELTIAKSDEFIDMINAYRVKKSLPIYVQNDTLNEKSGEMTEKFKNNEEIEESASLYRSYSVFNMYNEYLNDNNRFLTDDKKHDVSIGVKSYIDELDRVVTCLSEGDGKSVKAEKAEKVQLTKLSFEMNKVDKVTVPVIKNDVSGILYNEGDDVILSLQEQAANQYHIEVFGVEDDDYVINKYVTTDATDIVLPADLFKNGCDYKIVISSLTPEGQSLSSEAMFISYGSAYDEGVEIVTPYNEGFTDDDYLDVVWKSSGYHDFKVDLINEKGEIVSSKLAENKTEVVINNIDPGNYYVTVTAVRRGTEIEKAKDTVSCSVQLSKPVIEETVLDRNDKYYFAYEDDKLGVLYLYDEELVKEKGELKKKIIKKQVKATKAYKELAAMQIKREFTTGEPILTPTTVTASTKLGRDIVTTASKYLNVPYVWGGTTPDGFDCSGLVQYVMKSLGINVSRTSQEQIKNGVPVSKGDLQPGDLVFFESNGDVHHVGIYVGNGMMIHAPRTGEVIKYQSIETPYYQSEYAGARRVY